MAVATLVNTRGTTPRKEGAKMLVGEGGRVLGSVTIGGCVDAQVIEESAYVLDRNRPRLLELNLGDEEAWEIGLTCGGTIEVFMEPVTLDRPGDATLAFYERARTHADTGGRAAIVTRLDADGNGAKRLVLDTGAVEGSLGDPELDGVSPRRRGPPSRRGSRRRSRSRACAPSSRSSRRPPSSPSSAPATWRCRSSRSRGRSVSHRRGRRPAALRHPGTLPRRGRPADRHPLGARPQIPLIPTTALVLVAHDYKYDVPVLKHALASPVGYIGLLGSRRGAAILNLLREDGVAEDALARVRVPIGLDLGAQSAPEIALAILAEVLAVHRKATGMPIVEKVRRGLK